VAILTAPATNFGNRTVPRVYVHDTPWVEAWCWPLQDWEYRSCGMWCCFI